MELGERTKYVQNAFETLKDEKQIFYTIQITNLFYFCLFCLCSKKREAFMPIFIMTTFSILADEEALDYQVDSIFFDFFVHRTLILELGQEQQITALANLDRHPCVMYPRPHIPWARGSELSPEELNFISGEVKWIQEKCHVCGEHQERSYISKRNIVYKEC